MFALHYFFRSESVLDQFIENVANNVKQGGYLDAVVVLMVLKYLKVLKILLKNWKH